MTKVQKMVALVRPDDTIAFIAKHCSNNTQYCQAQAKDHYGAAAMEEFSEAGYRISVFEVKETKDTTPCHRW